MAKISSARDGGVIEASLESYGAERSEAVGDTDATDNVVFRLTPRLGQCPDGVSHFQGYEHGL